MKTSKPIKKLALTAAGFLPALVILKIVWILSARPKITVDYVAEYNRITRPHNYDPNQNAAEGYKKSFESYVGRPENFRFQFYARPGPNAAGVMYRNIPRIISWPEDIDDANRDILRQWLASNQQAIEHFRAAADKPYWWQERNVINSNDRVDSLFMQDIGPLRNLIDALAWDALVKSADGQHRAAFDDILSIYRAGRQICRSRAFLIEQSFGFTIKDRALIIASVIISRSRPGPEDLKNLQDSLQTEFNRDANFLDVQAEKLIYYDVLQRTFAYNRKGAGRLACCNIPSRIGLHNFQRRFMQFLGCFIGPTTSEMTARIDETFASVESIKSLPPRRQHQQSPGYFEKLNITRCDNCYDFGLDSFFPSLNINRLYHRFYQVKAREEALLTILAIGLFKAASGTLPASLDELVSSGFLQHKPADPYSDGPLIYHTDANDFTLYSVGENFRDDSGKSTESISPRFSYPLAPSQDIVFWPAQ